MLLMIAKKPRETNKYYGIRLDIIRATPSSLQETKSNDLIIQIYALGVGFLHAVPLPFCFLCNLRKGACESLHPCRSIQHGRAGSGGFKGH